MAIITVDTTSPAHPERWAIPPGYQTSAMPRGIITFAGTETIPAKLAADQTVWTLTCNFPTNFIYRLFDFRVLMNGTAGDVVDATSAMPITIVDDHNTWGFCAAQEAAPSGVESPLKSTTEVQECYEARGSARTPPSTVIQNTSGSANLQVNLVDPSGDTTAEFTFTWHIGCYQYDVSQLNAGYMHVAIPVLQ